MDTDVVKTNTWQTRKWWTVTRLWFGLGSIYEKNMGLIFEHITSNDFEFWLGLKIEWDQQNINGSTTIGIESKYIQWNQNNKKTISKTWLQDILIDFELQKIIGSSNIEFKARRSNGETH